MLNKGHLVRPTTNQAASDARYVLKAGDTMTGKLTITPTTGDDSLAVSKDIRLTSGRRVILNGN